MNVQFIKKVHEVDNLWSLYFEPPKKLKFIEGQFLEWTLSIKNPDKRGNSRWFTLSSSSEDKYLRITTRKSEPLSSFKKALFSLKKSQTVKCSSPMGDFVLPKDKSLPLLFIAIGVGVTPFISILKLLEQTKIKRDIQFIFQVENPNNYVFEDEITNFDLSKLTITDQRIDANFILKNKMAKKDLTYFLAGPEELVEKITFDLIKNGIDPSKVVTDYFPGYR